MKLVPIIWLIFTIMFFRFGMFHYNQSKHSFPRFEWESMDGCAVEFLSCTANENRINLNRFVNQWNTYIDSQNKDSHDINIVASLGFFASSIITFISMFIPGPYTIIDTTKDLHKKSTNCKLFKKIARYTKIKKSDNEN